MKRSKCNSRIRIVTRGGRGRSRKIYEKPKIEHEENEARTAKAKRSNGGGARGE